MNVLSTNMNKFHFGRQCLCVYVLASNALVSAFIRMLAALKLLSAKNNLPALINCAHGKDRTGIVSALVLSCLGKTAEYIAEEYALSSVCMFFNEEMHRGH